MGSQITDASPVGTDLVQVTQESKSTSIAAATAAAITVEQAHFAMAKANPRSIEEFRQDLLRQCQRPAFAVKAQYSIQRGETKIRGPSIRFAEAVFQSMRNISAESILVAEDRRNRTWKCVVIDYEMNRAWGETTTVEKTVERKFLKKGQVALGVRENSYGEIVHLVVATADEMTMKENAAKSKAFRNILMRMVPFDVRDECLTTADNAVRSDVKKDIVAARRSLIDAFSTLGVSLAEVEKYLGHTIEIATEDEVVDLRGVYSAIESRETSWYSIMRDVEAERAREGLDEKEPVAPEGASPAAQALLRRRGQAQAEPEKTAAPAAPPATPATPASAPPAEPAPEVAEAPRTREENWAKLVALNKVAKKGDAFFVELVAQLKATGRTKPAEFTDAELDQAVRACELATNPKK